jgi:2-polyprenyl-3-methyl-5-hydroxy-6-metoxy-1,4-benzoquinol methylase
MAVHKSVKPVYFRPINLLVFFKQTPLLKLGSILNDRLTKPSPVMNQPAAHAEEYTYGADVFRKEYQADGTVHFYKNGSQLSLQEWNTQVNRLHPQSLKEQHGNVIIRFLEQRRRNSLLRFIAVQPQESVADVGCETGFIAAELAKTAKQVTCVDIDQSMLDQAQARISASNVNFVRSNILDLQLPDGQVDVALASEILEHVPEIEDAVKELMRVTRPGGRIIISLPNDRLVLFIKSTLRRLRLTKLLGPLSEKIAIGHVNVYTLRSMKTILETIPGVTGLTLFYTKPFFLNLYIEIRK